jgi:hypothetical protein
MPQKHVTKTQKHVTHVLSDHHITVTHAFLLSPHLMYQLLLNPLLPHPLLSNSLLSSQLLSVACVRNVSNIRGFNHVYMERSCIFPREVFIFIWVASWCSSDNVLLCFSSSTSKNAHHPPLNLKSNFKSNLRTRLSARRSSTMNTAEFQTNSDCHSKITDGNSMTAHCRRLHVLRLQRCAKCKCVNTSCHMIICRRDYRQYVMTMRRMYKDCKMTDHWCWSLCGLVEMIR